MQRENWGSKFGFIMAAAGSAVGLGNIWRFPYVTGQNGGGAFVFVYLMAVLIIGLPMLFNEMALGRHTGKNPMGAFRLTMWKVKLKSENGHDKEGYHQPVWMLGAILSMSVSFFVMTYYGVIGGWTIGYIYTSLVGIKMNFEDFTATWYYVIPLFALFMVVAMLIVRGGISGGIEKASKFLMPLLFVLIGAVIVKSLTLPGAMKGVEYYLTPDFSKINGGVVLSAIGQAFFSLSIGWGIMITYGSYLSKKENMVSSGLWVGFTDTMVAILGGFMIFPAVFAFGKSPEAGPTLVFQVLPEIFGSMGTIGNIVGAMFFLLLCVAALTSAISIIEVPVSYLIDEKGHSRKKATWWIVGLTFLIGIPSALSSGGVEWFTNMSLTLFGRTYTGFLNIMDFVFGEFIIVIACVMVCVYSVWVYKSSAMVAELEEGCSWFTKPIVANISAATIWLFFMKWVCPAVIGIVLLNMVGLF
jgi:neurotransmitter:Na+ symporter, NSS family